MIARDEPVFPLRNDTLGGAAAVSLALCLLLPLAAAVCWLGGFLAWAGLWVVIAVLFVIVYALLIGGVLGAIGGALAAFGASSEEEKGQAIGVAVLGAVAAGLGVVGASWWGNKYESVRAAGESAFESCIRTAAALITDVWIGYGIVWLVWGVFAAALVAALGALAVIGLLRLAVWSRGPFGGVWYACPNGHRGGVAFACHGCGAWEDDLRPSPYGLLTARCTCGRPLPTRDSAGRAGLGKRCLRCGHGLSHPAAGSRHERHVLAWEPAAAGWLRAAAGDLTGGGAAVDPRAPATGPFPATLVAGPGCGGGLNYVFAMTGPALPPTADVYHRWLTGAVLVLDLPASPGEPGPDRAVAELLNFWDRVRVGRTGGRHPAVVGVAVRWAGGEADGGGRPGASAADSDRVRKAVESGGYENLVRALEARFRRVAFFALNRAVGAATPVTGPGAALGWVCAQIG